jgi:hypothetical protein
MKDQQVIEYLRTHDAVFLDEVTHYAGQVLPTLIIRNSHGESIKLPRNIHINHVAHILDRHDKLLEIGLTPTAECNLKKTTSKFDNLQIGNIEISELHSELADFSNQCIRSTIF